MHTAVTSFMLGILATTSPCVLPLYPGFLAYLSGQTQTGFGRQRYFLGLFVLAGVLSMMLILGGIISLLAVPIGRVLAYLTPLADLLILSLGLLLLFNYNPFRTLPQIQMPVLRHPFSNAYVYGLLYGPIAMPCSGPLVVSIFAVSFTVQEAFDKLWVFLWFGLGFGLLLFVLSLLSAGLQRQVTTLFTKYSRIINIVGGLLLIGIAIYDVHLNWDMLRFFFT
jgi:cytochrome c-type biogenesis protein